jgi:hypothetical protein
MLKNKFLDCKPLNSPSFLALVPRLHLRLIQWPNNKAGIFKLSMGARNRVGIGLSYWPARLHSTQPGAIGSLKSILGLLKSLKIRAQDLEKFFNLSIVSYRLVLDLI